MAGTNPAFDADVFRQAILDTMEMGLPTDTAERLTFHWERDRTYTPEDRAHHPYDLDATPTTDEPQDPDNPTDERQIVYALEFSARPAGSHEGQFGEFDTSRAVVTILDSEWVLIADPKPDYATIDGSRYDIDFSAPPVALFDATVYTLYLTAQDEA